MFLGRLSNFYYDTIFRIVLDHASEEELRVLHRELSYSLFRSLIIKSFSSLINYANNCKDSELHSLVFGYFLMCYHCDIPKILKEKILLACDSIRERYKSFGFKDITFLYEFRNVLNYYESVSDINLSMIHPRFLFYF